MGDLTFEEAAAAVKDLKHKPTDDQLLRLYGLFKIGSGDDIEQSKAPGTFDFKGKAKRNAWQNLIDEGFTQESAKQEYIKFVAELQEADATK